MAQSSWQDIQQNVFTRWANDHLSERGLHIDNLATDLCDGINLINLLESISGKNLGKYNKHPKVPFQKLANTSIAFDFIEKEGIKLVNISNEDVTNGRLRPIFGLLWTLILFYHIPEGAADLLAWVNSKIPEYGIQNFQKDWNDGKAICGLVNALRPDLCKDHRKLDPNKSSDNAHLGIDSAYHKMGIDKLIIPVEMVNPRVDKLAMMTYIAQFKLWEEMQKNKKEPVVSDASKCSAYGPGLQEAVQGRETYFVVKTPDGVQDKVKILIQGVGAECKSTVQKKPDGSLHVTYTPPKQGDFQVKVLVDGEHIPGSTFEVKVLEDESLGGEGMIRVFWTTTSSVDKVKSDNDILQAFLEKKKVHLRPDFEPWIPVDLLTKEDRDAVFRKAGTKKLPIVFIDDKYVGDCDTVLRLEKEGKLDKILQMEKFKAQMLTEKQHMERMKGVIDKPTAVTKVRPMPSQKSDGKPADWACELCSYENVKSSDTCVMCGNNAPHVRAQAKAAVASTPRKPSLNADLSSMSVAGGGANWTCPLCTYENTAEKAACDMCGTANPSPAKPAAAAQRSASPARAASPSAGARAASPSRSGADTPMSRIERLRLQMAEDAKKQREKHGDS